MSAGGEDWGQSELDPEGAHAAANIMRTLGPQLGAPFLIAMVRLADL